MEILHLKEHHAVLTHYAELSTLVQKCQQDLKNEFHKKIQIPAVILRSILSFLPLKNRGIFFQIHKSWHRLLSHGSSHEKKVCKILQFTKRGSMKMISEEETPDFGCAFHLTFMMNDSLQYLPYPKVVDSLINSSVKTMCFAGNWIGLKTFQQIQFYQVINEQWVQKGVADKEIYDVQLGCISSCGYVLLYNLENYLLWDIQAAKCTQTYEYDYDKCNLCDMCANSNSFYLILRKYEQGASVHTNEIVCVDISSGKSEFFFVLDEQYDDSDTRRAFCANEDCVFVYYSEHLQMIFIHSKESITFPIFPSFDLMGMNWAQDSLFILTDQEVIYRFTYGDV